MSVVFLKFQAIKNPFCFAERVFYDWGLAMTYSHMANATLPLAYYGFTSEFGKGSGGSHVLWSPDKLFELLALICLSLQREN